VKSWLVIMLPVVVALNVLKSIVRRPLSQYAGRATLPVAFARALAGIRFEHMGKSQDKRPSEVDLYQPVKDFLTAQGYIVRGEVRGCDLVAVRGDEPPVVVELKLRFNLALILQGIERLALTDTVYLAVPRRVGKRRESVSPDDRIVRKLCRMLGLGLMTVAPPGRAGRRNGHGVEIVLDPLPYRPRQNKRRAALLLGEHAGRTGNHNRGGVRGVPIVTAYRQEALRCAQLLARSGAMKVAALCATGLAPNAGRILHDDVYGWFERQSRGVYGLSENGRTALVTFAHALEALAEEEAVIALAGC
jgi:hypothetical protein